MTLLQIFDTYTAGSPGFCKAVQTHCGFNASLAEIKRIADLADTAEKFQQVWENDDSWTDENNAAEAA